MFTDFTISSCVLIKFEYFCDEKNREFYLKRSSFALAHTHIYIIRLLHILHSLTSSIQ